MIEIFETCAFRKSIHFSETYCFVAQTCTFTAALVSSNPFQPFSSLFFCPFDQTTRREDKQKRGADETSASCPLLGRLKEKKKGPIAVGGRGRDRLALANPFLRQCV